MLSADRSLELRRWAVAGIFGCGLLIFLTVNPKEPMDLRAFYCAGEAIQQRANPYRVEPNRSCQRAVLAAESLRLDERFVLPAPLPPYALVFFGALAQLPFKLAAELWLLLSTLAMTISIALVSKLSKFPVVLVGVSLVASIGYVSIVLGQVVPIAFAGAMFAAGCARRSDGSGAAVGASIAAIEPHLALPVWLGLALFLPSARKPLLAAAVMLGSVSLMPGKELNIEYFRSVVPEHARSELLNFGGQYSLSSLLAALGMPFAAALRAGSVCYAIMLGFGLTVAAVLKRRYADSAFVVTVPLASIVLGGPFLHITQTAVAIPLAFMLAGLAPRSTMIFGASTFAICMLAIPWQEVGKTVAVQRASVIRRTEVFRAAAPSESIELSYTAFVDAFGRRVFPRSAFNETLIRKVPTWLALIAILSAAASCARGPRRLPRSTRGSIAA